MISSNFASVSAENSSVIFLGVDDREWSIEDRVCAGVAAYSSFHFSIFHPQSSIFLLQRSHSPPIMLTIPKVGTISATM